MVTRASVIKKYLSNRFTAGYHASKATKLLINYSWLQRENRKIPITTSVTGQTFNKHRIFIIQIGLGREEIIKMYASRHTYRRQATNEAFFSSASARTRIQIYFN